MEATNDWIKFILSRHLKDSPGTRWVYNTGNTQILSAIIKKTSGLFLHEFAQKYLFEPLNIADYYWNCDPKGYTCAGGSDGGLRIKARDFIKLGMLYLNKGIWDNKRIISEQWIKKSTRPYIKTHKNKSYGYLWHIAKEDKKTGQFSAFYHSGSGGHFLIVFPTIELVIAWNSKTNIGKSLLWEILKIFQTEQQGQICVAGNEGILYMIKAIDFFPKKSPKIGIRPAFRICFTF
jgi:CubicO group peptidase (beta-lactamase class C family)